MADVVPRLLAQSSLSWYVEPPVVPLIVSAVRAGTGPLFRVESGTSTLIIGRLAFEDPLWCSQPESQSVSTSLDQALKERGRHPLEANPFSRPGIGRDLTLQGPPPTVSPIQNGTQYTRLSNVRLDFLSESLRVKASIPI